MGVNPTFAFEAGDFASAQREFATCLTSFPDNAMTVIFKRASKGGSCTLSLPQALS